MDCRNTYLIYQVISLFIIYCLSVNGNDVDCRPRETLVRTYDISKDGEHYTPQMITLYRCTGIPDTKPLKKNRCVATKTSEVEQGLFDMELHEPKSVTLYNETECKIQCVCKCSRTPLHKPTCELGFEWDSNACECIPRAITIAAKKDEKEKSQAVSVTTFVVVLVAELIVVLLVVFVTIDALRCRRKKEGVLYKTRTYMNSVSSRFASQHNVHQLNSVSTPKIKFKDEGDGLSPDGGEFPYEDNVFASRPDVNAV